MTCHVFVIICVDIIKSIISIDDKTDAPPRNVTVAIIGT
jgi:hypothetical protein